MLESLNCCLAPEKTALVLQKRLADYGCAGVSWAAPGVAASEAVADLK